MRSCQPPDYLLARAGLPEDGLLPARAPMVAAPGQVGHAVRVPAQLCADRRQDTGQDGAILACGVSVCVLISGLYPRDAGESSQNVKLSCVGGARCATLGHYEYSTTQDTT